nr:hypothetical protein [Tanacetum cinerariifolium]
DGSDDGNDDDNDETAKDGSERDEDDDDNDEEEEIAKIDKPEDTESGGDDEEVTESDREDDEEKTRQEEEESFDPIPRTPEENSHVTLTPVHPDGLQESSSVSSFVTSMLNPISDAGVESIFTTASSPIVSLQTPTPIMTPSTIAIQMTEAVREAVQIQTDRLQDSFQRENDEFLRTIDDNMKKIIKEQVKSQVQV